MHLLLRLRARIEGSVGMLPETVDQWLEWTVTWLSEDEDARATLLYDVKRATLGSVW